MTPLSPGSSERGPASGSPLETGKLIVMQPARMRELREQLSVLETIESLGNRVSERTGEDRSGDWSGAGAGQGGKRDDGRVSARDQAIAAMPPEPAALRSRLAKHIEREVHSLHALALSAARSRKPGAAYRVNELYARIRRLNALLGELVEASLEFLRKLFIRVFVDKQPVI